MKTVLEVSKLQALSYSIFFKKVVYSFKKDQAKIDAMNKEEYNLQFPKCYESLKNKGVLYF